MSNTEDRNDDQIIIEDGLAAKQLLESPYFQKVIENLKAAYIGNLLKTQDEQTDLREALYRRNAALDDVISTVTTAAMALDQLQTQAAEEAALDADDADGDDYETE